MAQRPGDRPDDRQTGWVDPDERTRVVPQQPRPTPPGRPADWVDPDGPTGVAPQQPRPAPGGPTRVNRPTSPPPQQVPPTYPQRPASSPPRPQPAPPPPMPARRQVAPHQQPHPYPPGGTQPPTAPFVGQATAGQVPAWKRHRRWLIVGGSVAGVLVLVIGLIVTLNSGSGSGGSGGAGGAASPAEAAKGYLEALSAGDAEKALSFQKGQPASKDFLTDEILGKQIAKQPITDIRILDDGDEHAAVGFAMVHVAANFGDTLSDSTLSVSKVDDSWYLESGVVKLSSAPPIGPKAARSTVTLFGNPVPKTSAVYVFPGFLDLGSTNPYIDVTNKPILLESLGLAGGMLFPKYTLNQKGQDAATQAVVDAFAACERSRAIRPPGCPTELMEYGAVDGTVQWGRADLRSVALGSFDDTDSAVNVSGLVHTPVSYQNRQGETVTGDVTTTLYTDIDVSKSPPVMLDH